MAYKGLGGEWKNMEVERPIDWEKRRQEIIEKSKRLSRSSELMKVCREIIKENMNAWIERQENEIERQERIGKARSKKKDY